MINRDTVKGSLATLVLMGVAYFFLASPYNGPWMLAPKPLSHTEHRAIATAIQQWFTDVDTLYMRYQPDLTNAAIAKTMTTQTLGELQAELLAYQGSVTAYHTDFQIAPLATQQRTFVNVINYYQTTDSNGIVAQDTKTALYWFTFKKQQDGQYAVLKVTKTGGYGKEFDGTKILTVRPNALSDTSSNVVVKEF